MKLLPVSLQSALATLVAALPLLAGTDPCTIGALAGRASMACVAQAESVLGCPVAPTPAPACPHCAPASPAKGGRPAPTTRTCCDLKPLASGAEQQPTLSVPSPALASSLPARAALAAPASDWYGRAVAARNAPPPGESLSPSSPRAPPLS
jgi:hypothetical protein